MFLNAYYIRYIINDDDNLTIVLSVINMTFEKQSNKSGVYYKYGNI